MRKLLTILIVLFFAVVAHAQSNKRIRIYQHNGAVDTLLMQNGSTITHSRLDLQGQKHDDIVSIIISNVSPVPVPVNVPVYNPVPVETRQYLIADIDSIVTPNGKRVVFRAVSEVPVPVNVPVKRTSFSGTFPGTAASGNVIFYWTENDHIRLDVGDESRAETLTSDKRGADFIFDDLDDSVGSYVVYYPDKTVTIPTVQTQ
nr:hypothetical protein [Prevotella sp.]